jgi:hypothetical protein
MTPAAVGCGAAALESIDREHAGPRLDRLQGCRDACTPEADDDHVGCVAPGDGIGIVDAERCRSRLRRLNQARVRAMTIAGLSGFAHH